MGCPKSPGKNSIEGEGTLKKLLILSYYFPPIGMGGSQRAAKFAKYLVRYGWQPTVVTVLPISYWAYDPCALEELEHIRVIRTESLDPQRILAKLGRQQSSENSRQGTSATSFINQKLVPFLLLPDSKRLWKWHCLKAVANLFKLERFDALLTTSPPHSIHLIGEKIVRTYKLPWLADFRDSWAGGVVVHEPTVLQKAANRHLQRRVLRNASAVTAVTRYIETDLSKGGAAGKTHYLPNGFDPADLAMRPRRSTGRFLFCHVGSVTQFSRPETLLKAIADLLAEEAAFGRRLEFCFVGQNRLPNFDRMIEQYHLEAIVTKTGYVSHKESLNYLDTADALVLIARGNEGAHFIPGKTFEYIGTLKPILAITNVVDTIDLLKRYSLAAVVDPEDRAGIKQALKMIVEQPPKPGRSDFNFRNVYDRSLQTKTLAKILDTIT